MTRAALEQVGYWSFVAGLLVGAWIVRRALRAVWRIIRGTPDAPPQQRPTGVYRVPAWAARTPQALREHPDLADIDNYLDAVHDRVADYYPEGSDR